MNNVVKCSYCDKIFIAELFESHKCDTQERAPKKIIDIPVVYFFDCTTKRNKNMVGVGIDGNHYWLVVKKREALPWNPSDESKQPNQSDEDVPVP